MTAPNSPKAGTGIVAYVPDLMDRSKVAAVAPATRFVSAADGLVQFASETRLAVIDLRRPGALEAVAALKDLSVTTVGFVSHVNDKLMTSAKAAGCTTVVARSVFFARLSKLLDPDDSGQSAEG